MNEEGYTVNNNLSLIHLLKLALRYIYVLIISGLICAVIAFSYCQFIAVPKYSATGSVLVTNGAIIADSGNNDESVTSKVSGTDISASLQLSNTIIDILKTNDIYKELAVNTGGKYTYEQLLGNASVDRRNTDTLFIDITFTASSPEEAKNLVNNFLELVPEYILKYIPNSNSAVTTTAEKAQKTYPRTVTTTAVATIVGAILSFAVVYIVSLFSTTINNEDDIKNNYDIMLIGNVPDFSNANSKNYYKYGYSKKGGYTGGK